MRDFRFVPDEFGFIFLPLTIVNEVFMAVNEPNRLE